ncbi:methionine--tRNA ligase [Candidatus Saccharibacteria bacterium]|nr:methionine--tRNA ligase [Candidatus Saccharibacteria bacterium]NCU40445.1 methionine--tRNA ligase [Candidatus Saccharibacteria bacterium]
MTKKNLYVTTAIPYANAKPHIGNAMDYLLADIWSRHKQQLGYTARFQAGTDEHGNKIAAKAQEAGMEPQAYVDEMHVNFKRLLQAVGAGSTDFVRTTDIHHKAAVQYIWQKLQPYLYKGIYEGWYCQGCESFVADKEASDNNGICPDHNQPYQRLSEENYYFKLSAFTDKIRDAFEHRRIRIVPEFRQKELMKLLESGLQDISFTRPVKSLSWGVPVPDDTSHVMYVWMDALSNYLTVLGYPDNLDWQNYWPADVQVIGKDILRFHAAIWPAMLIALDLPLPKVLLVHGFVTVNGAKMSKTIGNVIDPFEIIEEYGQDAFRYFFSRHIPSWEDGDFTWEKFEAAYNGELANDLGNLVSRIAKMVQTYQAGVVGDVSSAEHDIQAYIDNMEALNFAAALDEAWSSVRSLNQYLEDVKPWMIAKNRDTDQEAKLHLEEVLTHSVGSLLQIADLIYPFMPQIAEAIRITFKDGVVSSEIPILFPKKDLHPAAPTVTNTEPALPAVD